MAGGPHEGTYLVNPRHMAVNRPRNVTDEELSSAPSYFTRPLSEPTIMGYYLQRIRMSELSREMTDLTYGLEGDCIPANLADDLDAKFRMFLSELPAFLRVGKHVEGVTYVNGTPRAAGMCHGMASLRHWLTSLPLECSSTEVHGQFGTARQTRQIPPAPTIAQGAQIRLLQECVSGIRSRGHPTQTGIGPGQLLPMDLQFQAWRIFTSVCAASAQRERLS